MLLVKFSCLLGFIFGTTILCQTADDHRMRVLDECEARMSRDIAKWLGEPAPSADMTYESKEWKAWSERVSEKLAGRLNQDK